MRLWLYDPENRREALHIANWTPELAAFYEAETYRYLGIRPEPNYTWSKAFRPKKAVKVRKRKSAEVLKMAKRA